MYVEYDTCITVSIIYGRVRVTEIMMVKTSVWKSPQKIPHFLTCLSIGVQVHNEWTFYIHSNMKLGKTTQMTVTRVSILTCTHRLQPEQVANGEWVCTAYKCVHI